MSVLTSGWRSVPLIEAAHVTLGQSPPGASYNEAGDGMPFFQGKTEFTATYAEVCKFTTAGAKFAAAEDVLVSVRAPVGPTNLAPVDCAIGRGLAGLRAREGIDQRYLLWAMRATEAELAQHGAGSTFPAVTGKQLKAHRIAVAPMLEEQRRIVDLLEDHLSRLDAASVYLGAALKHANALRWSTIARAVEGAGGTEEALGELATVKNGIFISRPRSEANGVPILRIGAVRPLALDLTDLRYSERTEAELAHGKALLTAGDLLFTRYNGNPRYVGACAIVPEDALPLTYPDKLIRVRVTSPRALPHFVALACSVGSARAQIQASVKTTSGQAGISGLDLKRVRVGVPTVEAQRTMVDEVADLDMNVQRIQTEILAQQQRTAMMHRSLLAAAFSGRLTGQSSDLDRVAEMAGA